LQFVFPVGNLKRIISVAHLLRDILEEKNDKFDADAFQNTLKQLKKVVQFSTRDNPLHRQLWRLQDLSEGGGLGFTVELFFLALKQLSTSSSIESHSTLYVGTLQAITSEWRNYKGSYGTQELLLDLVVSNHNSISVVEYPANIVEKFLDLLDNILPEIMVSRIKVVEAQLSDRIRRYRGDNPRQAQCSKALDVITRHVNRSRSPPI
jgi:hypothetical protein